MSKNKSFPIFLAFLCMGFGDAVGPFVGLAKEQFSLSNFEAQIIAFMGFIMFGILSVPMGIFQDRKGKKTVLMLGLVLALVGLVIPLFGLSSYSLFLLTILLLGAGAAILQVAGNPIMRDVSPEGKYARNLTLGQFIKAIGSLSGSLIPFAAAKWFGLDWKILFPIYSAALLLTLVIIGFTRIYEKREGDAAPASFASSLSLLRNPFIAMMVLGIFLYVGAEVSISSGTPILLSNKFNIDLQTYGLLGNAFFFISILIGRFLGSVILNYLQPKRFLLITALLSITGLVLMLSPVQNLVFLGIFFTGLGFGNIFPLIFSITVDAMPERSNEISGLMVTAIVGGAIIPPLMGFVADMSSVTVGLLVPLAAMLYILYTAFFVSRKIHSA
ncbi:MAG: MFS transporter [Bacteroidales bacterium]|jgi:fucose permease|nr:MFS transporter [Bacteroidales bacterium]NLM93929.1 sugar MFS transporter [Bacteroidales bacterium]